MTLQILTFFYLDLHISYKIFPLDYGDVAVYQCKHRYSGPRTLFACGPDGQWAGKRPSCKRECKTDRLKINWF